MNKLILLLPIVLLMACINLTVGVPAVCDTLALGTVPGSPVANITLPPTSFSSKMDFSGAVSGLDSISNTVKADISQLTINNAGDLSWISEVDVSISTDSMHQLLSASMHRTASLIQNLLYLYQWILKRY